MKNQNLMFTKSVPKVSKARLFRSVLALGVVALIMQVSLPRAQAYDLSSLNGSYADFNSGLAPVSPGGHHQPRAHKRAICHYTRRACGRLMAQAASRHVWSSTSVAALYSAIIGI